MRDEYYLDHDDMVAAPTARRPAWRAAVGAVASLAVLGGVVTWTYRLGVRDAQAVPVIRALEGPARIRPDDPGGARFAHQGLSVYGALEGATAEPVEVALAPAPEPLADEDVSPAERAAAAETEAALELDALVAAALAEIGAADPAAPEATGTGGAAEIAVVAPTPQAPARSPAPPRAGAAPAAVSASADAPAPAAPAVSYAGEAPVGPMIQLGAYLTPEDASRMWRAISARNGDVLAGRSPVLGVTEQGGRTLHLLRAAPFQSLEEARALCAAMRSRGEDCLTVRPR